MAGMIGAVWGIAGLTLILVRGLSSVWPYVGELEFGSFGWPEWLGLLISLVFMGYAEGYKGFQLRFSPRVGARALYLKKNPTPVRIIFAPFFCMGFFHAAKARKITAYAVTTMVILLIILVRRLPQPWRGIIDAGVLFGLGWGLISVWIYSVKALCGKGEYTVSPETPDA